MMQNPFEVVNRRLDRLEELIQRLTHSITQNPAPNSTASTRPDLVKIDEASRITGYKTGYIYELVHRRKIPFIKRGKSLRFDPVKLEKWLRSDVEVS